PAPAAPPAGRPLAWLLLALPAALTAAVAGLIGIGDRQLWNDEYITYYAARLSWADLFRLLGNIDIVHALYYLCMHFWIQVAGTSMLALRLPSIVAMAVAAGALTVLGTQLFDRVVGVLAGLLFATFPAVSRYAQEARSYAWVTALAVLCTLALLYALRRPSWRRWLPYGACLLALTYLHFVAALLIAPHALLVWRARRHDGVPARPWLYATGAVALLAAPMLYLASGQKGQVDWVTDDWLAITKYPNDLFYSHTIAWTVVVVGLFGAVAIGATHRHLLAPLAVWALLPPLFCYLTFPIAHLFLAKYVLFTLPAWALLCAAAVVVPVPRVPRALARYRAVAIPAALVLSVVFGWVDQGHVRGNTAPGEPDFRAAAALVTSGYQTGDGIAYAGTNRVGRLPMSYLLHGVHPRDVFLAIPAARTGWYGAIECGDPAACAGQTPRIWLVSSNGGRPDPFTGMPASRAQYLHAHYTVASTTKLSQVRVLLLVRNPRA
ncbi:MAG TPA: glycosyltransferase family 39 protein, partial [Rugosimonospora sp.]|nr:glycosyltransferase family 39 protein [Rugosimonospora sp.]